ncbi:M48 family metallopeptidase [Thermocoleostomius sinensis]|uniref:M48 family metallopeptidase n=1 Tax=Thermocoleostomius sinensis A174 TaxID=2016057 RepID=A0A9E8ZCZ5_9CYAN|nr:M48 family metallopeptidase [Thermocoleostomius sinensis]WAL59577.1 M48 family metallopeptidase [Thermocoleostomius sinensis A174]
MEIMKIEGLNPLEYEHPLDQKGLNMLEKTPGLDFWVNKFYELGAERFLQLHFVGSNLKVTSSSLPDIYEILENVCETLNLKTTPELYVRHDNYTSEVQPVANNLQGITIGVDRPLIAISAECIESFSSSELAFILGCEIGRIKSRHVLYSNIAGLLPSVSGVMAGLTLGVNLTRPVIDGLNVALTQWYRWSEFTADRAGLLACQDLTTAMRSMAKIAGLPRKYFDSFDIDDFVTQAREYEGFGDTSYAKLLKIFSLMSRNQAFIVSRANELLKWIDSGGYQAVLERKTKIKPPPPANFCRHCGFKLELSNAFCSNCGQQTSA